MENASKALLIAGAILICILLIAVAMYVYNSANATIKAAGSQMSQQEKDMYNAKIKPYVGEGTKGSEVKSMIDNIISMNQENVGEQGKFIGITVGDITNYSSDTSLNTVASACQKASVYPMPSGETSVNPPSDADNTEDNVHNATQAMTKLKTKINSQKSYTVSATQVQGIYTWIDITEQSSSRPAGT